MNIDVTQTQGQNVDSLEKTRELSRGMLNAKGYELVSELGTGTYGVVWLAKDQRTGVLVAIKFFARGTGEQWQSLQEEVRQLAQLHAAPNIVRLLDVEIESWPPYYVMDFAEQGSLSARLKQGSIRIGEAVEMFRQIAQALAYVHAKGILHCDLKPGNILLDATGRALVADFGQAHLASDTSPALGTFFYMAPEQADLSQSFPDTRWDVYAIGAILYAMLTGRPPREDSTLKQQLENTAELSHRLKVYRDKVQSSARPRAHRNIPGVDRSLADIVDRCLELDPEKRFRDAQAVLVALRRRDRHRRQRSLVAFGMLVPVLLVLLLGLVAWGFTNRIVNETQAALLEETTRGDILQARLLAQDVAKTVPRHFEEYIRLVEQTSTDPEFVKSVEMAEQRGWNDNAVTQFLESRLRQHLTSKPSKADDAIIRWTYSDQRGIMRGNAPFSEKLHGMHFSWRDWFNGTGDKPEDSTAHYAPLRRRQISQPFFGKSGFPTMSISIPVWPSTSTESDAAREPLGVMALSFQLHHFYEMFESLKVPNRQIVLYNDRLQCLLHGDLVVDAPETQKWWPKENQNPPTWESDVLRQWLRADGATDMQGYSDPIDGKTYLAASTQVPNLNWIVVVQRERDSVTRRGDELRAEASKLGLYGMVMAGLLVPGAWGFLLWIIRREEQADA